MIKSVVWSESKYFKANEFLCSATTSESMDADFIKKLNDLREAYGKPITITSGFRHPKMHPIEAAKKNPGAHSTGQACDILIEKEDAFKLLSLAFICGFTGIGVNQKGGSRFLHLDTIENSASRPRPTIWSY